MLYFEEARSGCPVLPSLRLMFQVLEGARFTLPLSVSAPFYEQKEVKTRMWSHHESNLGPPKLTDRAILAIHCCFNIFWSSDNHFRLSTIKYKLLTELSSVVEILIISIDIQHNIWFIISQQTCLVITNNDHSCQAWTHAIEL